VLVFTLGRLLHILSSGTSRNVIAAAACVSTGAFSFLKVEFSVISHIHLSVSCFSHMHDLLLSGDGGSG